MLKERAPVRLLVSEETARAAYLENKTLLDAAVILAKRKVLIVAIVAIATCGASLVAVLLPNYYTANARILPPRQGQSLGYSALLGQLSPLLNAAGAADTGIHNPSDLYVTMLQSRTIADHLIDRFSLAGVYRLQHREDVRRRLAGLTEILAGKDGVISISVDDRDPVRAADLANAYVDELDKLTGSLAITEASQRRLFFEREVKSASDELAAAEDAFRKTQESSGLFQLDNQSKAMIESAATLRAQVAAKEIEIQSMQAFATSNNPDLVRAQEELSALRKQLALEERGGQGPQAQPPLANVPRLGLEYARGLREVKYREALFEMLAKQYEAARLDEAKDVAIIQTLDKAVPPELKSWPHRGSLVVSIALLALFVAGIIAFLLESFQNAREYPAFVSRLKILRIYFRWRRAA